MLYTLFSLFQIYTLIHYKGYVTTMLFILLSHNPYVYLHPLMIYYILYHTIPETLSHTLLNDIPFYLWRSTRPHVEEKGEES